MGAVRDMMIVSEIEAMLKDCRKMEENASFRNRWLKLTRKFEEKFPLLCDMIDAAVTRTPFNQEVFHFPLPHCLSCSGLLYLSLPFVGPERAYLRLLADRSDKEFIIRWVRNMFLSLGIEEKIQFLPQRSQTLFSDDRRAQGAWSHNEYFNSPEPFDTEIIPLDEGDPNYWDGV